MEPPSVASTAGFLLWDNGCRWKGKISKDGLSRVLQGSIKKTHIQGIWSTVGHKTETPRRGVSFFLEVLGLIMSTSGAICYSPSPVSSKGQCVLRLVSPMVVACASLFTSQRGERGPLLPKEDEALLSTLNTCAEFLHPSLSPYDERDHPELQAMSVPCKRQTWADGPVSTTA